MPVESLALDKAATDLSDEEWSQILTTNLTGAFYCARAAGRYMLSRGWGRVINVTCIYGYAWQCEPCGICGG